MVQVTRREGLQEFLKIIHINLFLGEKAVSSHPHHEFDAPINFLPENHVLIEFLLIVQIIRTKAALKLHLPGAVCFSTAKRHVTRNGFITFVPYYPQNTCTLIPHK